MASYRKATLADRQQVVDMQVYEGLDYIQNVYNQHLTEWNSSAYVGEKDGKIVAFHFITLVDDGDTIISRGARTREEYKHQGIINGLYEYAFNDFTERYPSVSWKGGVRHVIGHVTTKPETRIVCKAPFCTMKPISPDTILRHYGKSGRLSDYGSLQQLTKGQIHRLFTTQEVATKLFGEYNDHVVISWMPYRTMSDTNVQIIMEHENPTVFADIGGAGSNFDCTSASFSTRVPLYAKNYPSGTHVKFDIDIYSSDREMALKHLYSQVYHQCTQARASKGDIKIHFMVFLNCPLEREAVFDALVSMGMKPRTNFLGGLKDPRMFGSLSPIERAGAKEDRKDKTKASLTPTSKL